jgi:methionine synthase II (cobalamin-independent)
MDFEPHFLTTHVGSLPHNGEGVPYGVLASLDLPAWPQLVNRVFLESMWVQYSAGMPGAVLDRANEKLTFDTANDLTPALEAFYERYLAEDVASFSLSEDYAAGFHAMLDVLRGMSGRWAKGQVTGPVSFGLTAVDQDLRSVLYHDLLADAIVKHTALGARWQVRRLKQLRPNVMIFVDEPYMASFGSAFVSLSREQVITMLDEVFDAIHEEGALAGVHCCGNTDWSVLLATTVDVLNIDAFDYLESLSLYPAELRAFLDRGGVVAWGIVPNDERVDGVTPESLACRLREGFALIAGKAARRGIDIGPQAFEARSLITPRCGLGPATVPIADRALELLAPTAAALRGG